MSKYIFKTPGLISDSSSSDDESCPHAAFVDCSDSRKKKSKMPARYADFTLDIMEEVKARNRRAFNRNGPDDDDDIEDEEDERYGKDKKYVDDAGIDDFEKEMYAELSDRLTAMRRKQEEEAASTAGGVYCDEDPLAGPAISQYIAKRNKSCLNGLPATNVDTGRTEPPHLYNTDNNSDMAGDLEKDFSDKEKLTNDDLFYDPNIDADNEEWVGEMRRRYRAESKPGKGAKKASSSDAELNCPACMSLLCLDCQRHELYENQYRAMFVTNCVVNHDALLHYPRKNRRGAAAGRKRKQGGGPQHQANIRDNLESVSGGVALPGSKEDQYHPVMCKVCSTEVAVYDSDEIYHFYNVLAGHA